MANPSIKSDVVGSLLRPAFLMDARAALDRGDLTPAEFKAVEDRAVDEAVALQEAAGLDVVTDGEVRRLAFYGHLVDALEGFDNRAGWSITFRDRAVRMRPRIRAPRIRHHPGLPAAGA